MNDEQRLQVITEMLVLVRDNLFQGMSKSIQKLQAESINEVLGLAKHTQTFKEKQEMVV
jgi:hypothetical protein